MMFILWILLVAASIAIAYQDFKARSINLILIICYGILGGFRYTLETNFILFLNDLLFTGCYLLLVLLFITIYFYFKNGKLVNVIDSQIGIGDLLLFICIGGCLEPFMLINFFTTCFIFSLLCYLIFFKGRSVPLAGLSAIFYLMFYVVQLFLIWL